MTWHFGALRGRVNGGTVQCGCWGRAWRWSGALRPDWRAATGQGIGQGVPGRYGTDPGGPWMP